MAVENSKKDFSFIAKGINGGVAGLVGVSSVFPIDLVKTRLQNQQIGPNGEELYKGIVDCFKKIYRAEGLAGMYRGLLVTILLVTPEKAIKLAGNDFYRHFLTSAEGTLTIPRELLAGGLAGFSQTIISTPLELIKIQMQLASLQEEYKDRSKMKAITARSVLRKVIQDKNYSRLFQGLFPTIVRDVTFSTIFFPLFSSLRKLGRVRENGEFSPWCSLFAGFGAGSISAFLVTPFDVLKTRAQASLQDGVKQERMQDFMGSLLDLLAKEGPTALFKGGLCRVMVIAPLLGIAQLVYFLGIGEAFVNFFRI